MDAQETGEDPTDVRSRTNDEESSAGSQNYDIKCQELSAQVKKLTEKLMEGEARSKAETTSLRRQMNSEIREICMLIDQAQKDNGQCHKTLKRHSAMMLDLQEYCEDLEKRLEYTNNELTFSQKRCVHLERELEELKSKRNLDSEPSTSGDVI